MRNNKLLIYFVTVVLVIFLVALVFFVSDNKTDDLFSIKILASDNTEVITCFEDEDDHIYIFLPSYAQLSDAVIQVENDNLSIDGVVLKDGMSLSCFETDKEYELSYTYFGNVHTKSVSFLKSENVAAMHIDTQSGSMEYIHDKKGNKETGLTRIYSADGELDYSGDIAEINGRGNSTWDYYDKKPYGVTLTQEADLLSLGSAQNWVLYANANEASNLRNKVLYELAHDVGLHYNASTQWVDLYLNGEYAGLYLLSEKNEVHKERVDIDLQDSFLVSLEYKTRMEKGDNTYILTDNDQAIRLHYPKTFTDEYLVELKDTFQSIENAVMAQDGVDPDTGKHYTQLIDIDSWARKYVLEEVVANWDACAVSQYFYYDSSDPTGKVYASPVWDYDNTMGQKMIWIDQPANAFYGNKLNIRDDYEAVWFYNLYQKEEFLEKVKELYSTEIRAKTEQMLSQKLYEYSSFIEKAGELNSTRWNTSEDVSQATQKIDSFMKERLEFLDSVWVDEKPYYTVKLHNTIYVDYAVFGEEGVFTPPVPEDTQTQTFIGWYYEGTDIPFDNSEPIDRNIQLYAKWETNSGEKIEDMLKLIPALLFAVLFICLFFVEIKRLKKR